MPFYDYQCEKCEAYFEVERPMGAAGRVKCMNCGSTRTTKVFAPAGVVFKGSGFYVTDSNSKSSATASSLNGSEPKPGAASDSKKESTSKKAPPKPDSKTS